MSWASQVVRAILPPRSSYNKYNAFAVCSCRRASPLVLKSDIELLDRQLCKENCARVAPTRSRKSLRILIKFYSTAASPGFSLSGYLPIPSPDAGPRSSHTGAPSGAPVFRLRLFQPLASPVTCSLPMPFRDGALRVHLHDLQPSSVPLRRYRILKRSRMAVLHRLHPPPVLRKAHEGTLAKAASSGGLSRTPLVTPCDQNRLASAG